MSADWTAIVVDLLPGLTLLSLIPAANKHQQMDSNATSASPLQNTSPPLNPAEVSKLHAAFAYQTEVLKGYQDQLPKLQSVNKHLTHYIQSLPSTMPKMVSFALPDKLLDLQSSVEALFIK